MWEQIRGFFEIRINKVMLAAILVLFGVMLLGKQAGNTDHETGKKILTIGAFTGSYWDYQNGFSYHILDDAIKRFEKEHPDVEVRYTSGITREDYTEWLAEKMVKGKSPDLFFVPNEEFGTFVQTKSMMNLDDIIRQDTSFHSGDFYEKTIKSGQWEGHQYAIPYECSPTVMMVNQTLLKKAGISSIDSRWTWDDMYDICQKIAGNKQLKNICYVENYEWKDAFLANRVHVINKEGTKCNFTGRRVYQSISFLEKLQEMEEKTRDVKGDFFKGNVVFEPMLFSAYRAKKTTEYHLKKEGSFDWGYTAMPSGPSGSNCAMVDVLSLAISSQSRYPKEAWELLKTLTYDPKIQAELFDFREGISPLRSVTESQQTVFHLKAQTGVNLDVDVISQVMKDSAIRERYSNYTEVQDEIDTAVNDIINTTANIQMEQILWDKRINQYLQKLQ
ncbi:MAG: extracellular solute-binding protein [Lachnospiraceae bacterium]|nr:extracellular solute-binding protein [Lachnospiraceae bacterium]